MQRRAHLYPERQCPLSSAARGGGGAAEPNRRADFETLRLSDAGDFADGGRDRRDHPELHRILVELGKLTGREVALVSSFNVADRPLVNSPRQALEVVLETGIEYLILDNCLIRNRRARTQAPPVEDSNALSHRGNLAARA